MKTSQEVFKEVLEELGFAGYKPDQMTNSDYWLCTCTAMERFAESQKSAIPIVSEWVAVEDRLPNEKELVVIKSKDVSYPEVAWYEYSEWYLYANDEAIPTENVFFWKPLEQPP